MIVYLLTLFVLSNSDNIHVENVNVFVGDDEGFMGYFKSMFNINAIAPPKIVQSTGLPTYRTYYLKTLVDEEYMDIFEFMEHREYYQSDVIKKEIRETYNINMQSFIKKHFPDSNVNNYDISRYGLGNRNILYAYISYKYDCVMINYHYHSGKYFHEKGYICEVKLSDTYEKYTTASRYHGVDFNARFYMNQVYNVTTYAK